MRTRYLLVTLLTAFVVAADQLSKYWVVRTLAPDGRIAVVDSFFDLVYVLNRGAAFGLLNRADITWQKTFFIVTALLALGIIIHIVRSSGENERLLQVGLGLISGGASGNLIDRIRLGEVIDFLDVYVGAWHWPAFNVADSAISVGAILVLLSYYRRGRSATANSGAIRHV